jgi:hypothetical protein
MAVPFRAKDLPANRAEFGQSDMLISFTLLSYYEEGLSLPQMVEALKRMAAQGPMVGELEYAYWLETAVTVLPSVPHRLQGINLADAAQLRVVHRHLRRNMRAVNYWLANFVLPHQTKQFPEKIETSACDLANLVRTGDIAGVDVGRKYPLASASGTNDTQYFLPHGTTQINLPELSNTNGLVVFNIIRANRPANRTSSNRADAVMDFDAGAPTSVEVLTKVIECNAQVLLDPGAIMRDLPNREMAQEWLKRHDSAEGVLFFEDNRKQILERHGRCMELLQSPLRNQLAHCLVYPDDSHTRGTDIKLPRPMHAACTLGPALCKDKLTQALMRMRQLGDGHTVTLLALHEVSTSLAKLAKDQVVSAKHVLVWAMRNSIKMLRNLIPIWTKQSLAFASRVAVSMQRGMLRTEVRSESSISVACLKAARRWILVYSMDEHDVTK